MHISIASDKTTPCSVHGEILEKMQMYLVNNCSKKFKIFTGMLLRVMVQSWVRGPVVFTVAKAIMTLEKRAEKQSSTSTPQRNISRLFLGISEGDSKKLLKHD